MKKLPFVKIHGTGNDFVVLHEKDIEELSINLNESFIQKICNRSFWIGSDGLLVVTSSKKADFGYDMYNPDWSKAEMCGNGIRCYMRYLIENKLTEKTKVNVETPAWILEVAFEDNLFTVNMGSPTKMKDITFKNKKLWDRFFLKASGKDFLFTPVSMGNPHAVIFLNEPVKDFDLRTYGPLIENNTEIFPERTNAEFINVISDTQINMRVWERGAWETLSCGTCACAWVVAGILAWFLKKDTFIKVSLIWWILYIKWSWYEKDNLTLKWNSEIICDWFYYIQTY